MTNLSKHYSSLLRGSGDNPVESFTKARELSNEVKSSPYQSICNLVRMHHHNENLDLALRTGRDIEELTEIYFANLTTKAENLFSSQKFHGYNVNEVIFSLCTKMINISQVLKDDERLLLGLTLLGLLGSDVIPIAMSIRNIRDST